MMNNNQMLNQPSEQLNALAHSFEHGLEIGQHYVKLLTKLAQTEDAHDLFAATNDLVNLDLEDAFVKFPQHYQAADYYLLLMGRLLEMHSNTELKITEDPTSHRFYATISALGEKVLFHFIKDAEENAVFTDVNDNEPIFSLNLKHQMLRFNNKALVNYFIINGLKKYSDLDLRSAIKPLLLFAQALHDDLNFVIDRGILDTSNQQHYDLAQLELSLTVIDRLFVATAETDYMLFNLPKNNGAELRLERQVNLDLSFDPDDYSQQWFFSVQDPDAQVSLFDLLLHYQLIRDWYLNNRDELAVKSDPLIFADDEQVEQDEPTTDESVLEDDEKND
ncbi:hypothetical protein HUK45_01135 [Limosilactobacillus sp. c9Ua_26_M]|uniref:DUF4868 domain-containing protein n=2 Tax=Limosilactobacillus urinaemulieris TaxID=2742600 RepID=A0ABR8ZJ14_9LACO|nr:hypothetical protein [Limosilactobacillus urinaemulieris]MBD8084880.1 hypothetical protein [Limosilactobacillus urinaemulieris]